MTSGSHDSLADALKNMTGHEPAPRPQDEADVEYEAEVEAEIDGEVDDESGEVIAAAPKAVATRKSAAAPASRGSSSRRTPPRRKGKNDGLKSALVPVFLTVGALLLFPAIWSVLTLSGAIVSSRSSAKGMAMLMLICWPLALSLIGAGVYFAVQLAKAKKG